MPKLRKWLTFEKFAQMFLDFGREFNAAKEGNTAISIEIQMEEFKLLWTKVKDAYEVFAIGNEEYLGDDRKAARVLFGHCRF